MQHCHHDVDVGIIFTDERGLMTQLVSSLSGSEDQTCIRLILIDNASQGGTEPWESMFTETTVIRNIERCRYAENLNQILAASTARYVLLLNTDVYFDREAKCVSKMVQFMDAHPQCGISGCRIYHPDGSYAFPARRFQTLKAIAARRLGMQKVFPQAIRQYLCMEDDRYDTTECDWISGCFMLLRRETFEAVGNFDSRFAKYFEDVDMSLRVAGAGWRVMLNGQTYCYHHEQRDSKRVFSRDGFLHLQSYARWLSKWGFDPRRHLTAAGQIRRAA